MKLLISIVVCLVFGFAFEKNIRKYPKVWYGISIAVSALVVFLPEEQIPVLLVPIFRDYLKRGTIATALFVLVMYAIVMPPKSKFQRMLMTNRRDFAIMGAFMIFIHNISYGKYYYVALFTQPGILRTNQLLAAIVSVVLVILLIPLTITSFPSVRKKMTGGRWKKFQRWSYLFYGLIYIHVALLYVPQLMEGSKKYLFDFLIYTLVFGIYGTLRMRKYLIRKKSRDIGKTAFVCGVVLIAVVCIPLTCISIKSSAKNLAASKEKMTYQDGVWIGEGYGFKGNTKVEVTIVNDEIESISVLDYQDDEAFFFQAENGLLDAIIESQSVDLDAVSGATYSSKGILAAVNHALEQAKNK